MGGNKHANKEEEKVQESFVELLGDYETEGYIQFGGVAKQLDKEVNICSPGHGETR